MPKRVGFLYDRMLDKAFIRDCIRKACRHKMKRRAVRRVANNLDRYTDMTYELLKNDAYTPTPPHVRVIFDDSSQKERKIQTVPFWPDAVVQWVAVEAAKPVLMRGMYYYCCASVPGRGGARVYKRLKSALRNDKKGTKYAAEMDIRKYYPSLDPARVMAALGRKIKDRRYLRLVESIIRSGSEGGLAIGLYINQWMANCYLEPLDHYLKARDGVKYMTRHMDNIVMLGPNKRKLRRARAEAEIFMRERLNLQIKGDWQAFPVQARRVRAVGYRFGRGDILLRKRTLLRMTRQIRRIGKRQNAGLFIAKRQARSAMSRRGNTKHFASRRLMEKYGKIADFSAIRRAAA